MLTKSLKGLLKQTLELDGLNILRKT
jgi:hypothetical protein